MLFIKYLCKSAAALSPCQTGGTGALPLLHLLALACWHCWSQIFGLHDGSREAVRAPSQIPAIQMGNVGMEMLCRNLNHQQRPLVGGGIQASTRAKEPQIGGESLLQAMARQRDGNGEEGSGRAPNN